MGCFDHLALCVMSVTRGLMWIVSRTRSIDISTPGTLFFCPLGRSPPEMLDFPSLQYAQFM